MNASVHESIGVSPAQLLFGNSLNLELKMLTNPPESSDGKGGSLSKWSSNMLNAQNILLDMARNNQEVRDENYLKKKKMESGKTTSNKFEIGNFVLVRYVEKPPTKFHTNLKGPMKIISKLEDKEAFILFNLVTNKEEEIHVSRMFPFNFDESNVDPRLVANKDYQVFDVEKIIDHNGDGSKVSEMDFLVKWKGFEDYTNLWLPWKELRNNPELHIYLEANGMKKLIPKEYKKKNN
jgi:hypothetical protein